MDISKGFFFDCGQATFNVTLGWLRITEIIDLVVIDNFDDFNILEVYKKGRRMYDGTAVADFAAPEVDPYLIKRSHETFHLPRMTAEDFRESRPRGVLGMVPGEIVTVDAGYAEAIDPAADVLLARNVIKDQVTYGDDGREVDRKPEYERESGAVFFVNDRGQLVILNAGDEALAEMIFERVMNENQGDAGVTEWNLPETTEVTADLKAEFDKAMAGLLGVNYEPVAFLADKDGVNCFLARCTAVYPDAKPYYALVYMNDEGVKNVWDLWLDAHANP